jgi:hypothetical protein
MGHGDYERELRCWLAVQDWSSAVEGIDVNTTSVRGRAL